MNGFDVACWHFRDIARSGTNVCFRRKSGRVADITAMTGFDVVDGARSQQRGAIG